MLRNVSKFMALGVATLISNVKRKNSAVNQETSVVLTFDSELILPEQNFTEI